MEPAEGLPKTQRLYRKKEIGSLFEAGKGFNAYPFRVIVYPHKAESQEDAIPRILVSVSKKRFHHAVKRNKVKFTELPKFPEVRRDLALLVDEAVSYADMRKAAIRAGKKMVKSVGLFDVYRGDKIPAGKKQYAMSFVLQDPEKTLTDMDSERIIKNILGLLQKDFGAQIR